ncbi:MAG: carbonic anhydrase [Patescibacteria group bacterium]
MNDHTCEAIIVTCIDFRFQPFINDWISKNFEPKTYDRVSWAGSIKDQEGILKQIEISHRLHHTKKAVLINHEDCGAYGAEGNPERHTHDLKEIKEKIQSQFPDMQTDLYYLHLDGTFEQI